MTQDQLEQAVAQAAVDFILPKLDDKSIVGGWHWLHRQLLHRRPGPAQGCIRRCCRQFREATAARLKGHGIPVYEAARWSATWSSTSTAPMKATST